MISVYIIPCFITLIILSSFKNKVPLYDTVVEGAEEGMMMVLKIMPTMVIILTAVYMLHASGILEALGEILSPALKRFNIPSEIVPMVALRPISGSGALGILTDNLKTFGPDSRVGLLSSIIMGSTETTFYTIAVYFSSTNIKNCKRVIPAAIIGDVVGIITAFFIICG